MRNLIRLLLILSASLLSLSGHAQSRFFSILNELPVNHSTAEVAQLLLALQPIRGVDANDATITLRVTLVDSGNPYVLNISEASFTLGRLMKVDFRLASTQADGTACLLVSVGEAQNEWCGVPVEDNRLRYRVRVERSVAELSSGVAAPVAAGRASATMILYEGDSGATQASSSGGVDVVPIAVIDDNAFLNPSNQAATGQALDEVVELFVSARTLMPRELRDEPAMVRFRFVLVDPVSLLGPNFVDVEVGTDELARFRIETGASQGNGEVALLVNGTEVGRVRVEDYRVAYLFGIQSGATAKFLAGGEIPIPAERARGITIAIAHVEDETGATRSYAPTTPFEHFDFGLTFFPSQ